MNPKSITPALGLALIALLPATAWASSEHGSPTGMPSWIYLAAAGLTLGAIVGTSLKVENLLVKTAIFLGLGCLTVGGLLTAAHFGYHTHEIHHVLMETYGIDYPKFIVIPMVTATVAAMGLFDVHIVKEVIIAGKVVSRIKNESNIMLGWFLWLVLPLLGNFTTTWTLVPIGLGLVPIMILKYGDRWLFTSIATNVFAMNMLALATLLADPPQALLALKWAAEGRPVGFFFPLEQFWAYLIPTWALYAIVLKRCGVQFGHIKNLLHIQPKSWTKAGYGITLIAALAYGIMEFSKPTYPTYTITLFLGTVMAVAMVSTVMLRKDFDHEVRERLLHWNVETMSVFVAFFAVVSNIMTFAKTNPVSNEVMVMIQVVMTWCADNAAAFATGYPQFAPLAEKFMVWYALFPDVVNGGMTAIGNGPQITLYLVILTSGGVVTVGLVFKAWFDEALVYLPYLMTWQLSAMICLTYLGDFPILFQLLTGILALMVACVSLLIQQQLRVGMSWDGRDEVVPANRPDGYEKITTIAAATGK